MLLVAARGERTKVGQEWQTDFSRIKYLSAGFKQRVDKCQKTRPANGCFRSVSRPKSLNILRVTPISKGSCGNANPTRLRERRFDGTQTVDRKLRDRLPTEPDSLPPDGLNAPRLGELVTTVTHADSLPLTARHGCGAGVAAVGARGQGEKSQAIRHAIKSGEVTEKIPSPDKGEARAKAAAIANVNPRYVSDAKKIKEEASALRCPRLKRFVPHQPNQNTNGDKSANHHYTNG